MKFTTTLLLSSIFFEATTATSDGSSASSGHVIKGSAASSGLRQRNLKDKKEKKEKKDKDDKEDDEEEVETFTGTTQAPPELLATTTEAPPKDSSTGATVAAAADITTTELPECKGKACKEGPENEDDKDDVQDKGGKPGAQVVVEFDLETAGKAQKEALDERAEDPSILCPECVLDGAHICAGSCFYFSGDDVTVSFRTAPLEDYTNLGHNITNVDDWKLGIFMRMGHPQQGRLEPIVSLKPTTYGAEVLEGSATFGASTQSNFGGTDATTWPLNLNSYGTGYDAWLLDENGAELLGPYPFSVKPTEEMVEAQEAEDEERASAHKHGIAAHSKASKTQEAYTADGKPSSKGGKEQPAGSSALDEKPNSKAGKDQDDKEDKDAELGVGKDGAKVLGTYESLEEDSYIIDTNKYAYSPTDSVSISFELGDVSSILAANNGTEGNDITEWTIGIYMRMANPQDGDLDPLVSLPLCGLGDCSAVDPTTLTSGTVTFGSANVYDMDGTFADWPLDLNEYGTGYDVWLLNGAGVGLAGPTMFTIPVLDDVERID